VGVVGVVCGDGGDLNGHEGHERHKILPRIIADGHGSCLLDRARKARGARYCAVGGALNFLCGIARDAFLWVKRGLVDG